MAVTGITTTSFLLHFGKTTSLPRKPLVVFSSLPASSPSILRPRRKNYLRQKLLKTLTLTQPLLPESPSPNPIISIEFPHEQKELEFPSGQFSGAGEEPKESGSPAEIQLAQTSDPVGFSGPTDVAFSTRSVLKIGLYLVGAFVFQTIVSVLVLGSADLDNEEKSRVSELSTTNGNIIAKPNGVGKFGIGQNGVAYIDESELEDRVVEIQKMASEARETERLNSKANNLSEEEGEDDDDGVLKTAVGKEVNNRLVRLQKTLQNRSGNSSVPSVALKRIDGKVKNGVSDVGLDVNANASSALMFKKKYKFKSPSVNTSDKPKGFMGEEDYGATKMKSNDSAREDEMPENEIGDKGMAAVREDMPAGNLRGSISMPLEEDKGRKPPAEVIKSMQTQKKKFKKGRERVKLGKGMEVSKAEPITAVKSGEPSKAEMQNDHDATTLSGKSEGLSRGIKVENQRAAGNAEDKNSVSGTDQWWLTLPYVLVILMRRGGDDEGLRVYTVKSISQDKYDLYHTVTFEDHGDATNFCYLLHSFFQDLADFDTDIVPLPIKELNEAVKSKTMKVLVVKKGQLQLYAGQPLTDVEMALRSMIVQGC